MTKNYSVRTDLALEERERFESDQVEISGVILEEDYDESSETRITRVIIETENGAKAMGKPAGVEADLPELQVRQVQHMDISVIELQANQVRVFFPGPEYGGFQRFHGQPRMS